MFYLENKKRKKTKKGIDKEQEPIKTQSGKFQIKMKNMN